MQLSKHPKFYFCDSGINNAISRLLRDPLESTYRGKMFEQWFINEVRARLSYSHSDFCMYFWRVERGDFEVDLILAKAREPKIAIEVKAKHRVISKDLRGLLALKDEFPKCELFCVCETDVPYEQDGILIMPVLDFLKEKLI